MKISIAVGKGKKEGDIIAVKPAGWKWGTEEYKHFLIMEIDLGTSISTIEDAQKLTVPQFETDELWWPSSELPRPKIINKRRYKLPVADIVSGAGTVGVTIDLIKIRQPLNYQPLEKKILPFNVLFFDKILNRKLTATDLVKIANEGKVAK